MYILAAKVTSLLLGLVFVTRSEDTVTYEGYSVIRATPVTSDHLVQLKQLYENRRAMSLDFWKKPSSIGDALDVMVPPKHYKILRRRLQESGIPFKTSVVNVQRLLDRETAMMQFTASRRRDQDSRLGLGGFDLDRYHSYDQMMNHLQTLARWYPNIVELITAPEKTLENRTVQGVKIGNKYTGRRFAKPAVWIDGGIHAREWIAPAVCMYFINTLIDGYRSFNQTIMDYVDRMDFYIFPVLNPDGYEYSRSTARLWRKNKRKVPTSRAAFCHGVDLNRNFDWYFGEIDSSRDSCDDTYAGKHAFSEPETANVKALVSNIGYRLKAFFALHSYAQVWSYPYGHERNYPAPNVNELKELANEGARRLKSYYGTEYKVDTAANALYPASGGAADWAKGRRLSKYAFLMELVPNDSFGRTNFFQNGFVIPERKIVPTGKETWGGMTAIFDRILYQYARVR